MILLPFFQIERVLYIVAADDAMDRGKRNKDANQQSEPKRKIRVEAFPDAHAFYCDAILCRLQTFLPVHRSSYITSCIRKPAFYRQFPIRFFALRAKRIKEGRRRRPRNQQLWDNTGKIKSMVT